MSLFNITYNSLNYTIDTATNTAEVYGADRSLQSVSIASSVPYQESYATVVGISPSAFMLHDAERFDIPSSIKYIGEKAFQYCRNYSSIIIPNSVTSVGEYAFANCTNISSFSWSDNVTAIPVGCFRASVFKNDNAFLEAYQKDTINAYAFEYCSGVSMFHEGILEIVNKTYIGGYAFSNSKGFDVIVIVASPDETEYTNNSLRGIDDIQGVVGVGITPSTTWGLNASAINPSSLVLSGIKYGIDTTSQTATVIGNTTITEKVYIPHYILDGWFDVGIVDGSSFKGNQHIKSVSADSNIAEIRASAFADCTSLTSFYYNGNGLNLGDSVFENCTQLSSLDVSNKDCFDDIGYRCFYNTGLTDDCIEKMPSSVDNLGEECFSHCNSLKHVIYPFLNQRIIPARLFSNCQNLKTFDGAGLIYGIDDAVFYGCSSLQNVSGIESITSIGDQVFYGDENLLKITLPNITSINNIGESAFTNSQTRLILFDHTEPHDVSATQGYPWGADDNVINPEYTIANGIQYELEYSGSGYTTNAHGVAIDTPIGQFQHAILMTDLLSTFKTTGIEDYCFRNRTDLQSVDFTKLDSSFTTIGSGAFSGCSNITSCNIPSSVSTIKEYTFKNAGRGTITIPDSITSVQPVAFENTTYSRIEFSNTLSSIPPYVANSSPNLTSIKLPDNCVKIEAGSFSACSALQYVDIPSSVTSIGDSCFAYTSLTGMNMPYGTIQIGNGAFAITNLTSAHIPSSVTSIGSAAFIGCRNLSRISIPSSCKSIGYEAFKECVNLSSVEFPEYAPGMTIGAYAFENTNQTQIILPSGLSSNSIGLSAFATDTHNPLELIYIPGYTHTTVSSMANYPWGVTESVINPSAYVVDGIKYGLIYNNFTAEIISADDSVISAYPLSSILNRFSVTGIAANGFNNCHNLKYVDLSHYIYQIGNAAFKNCTSLDNVNLNNIAVGNQSMFDGCLSLKNINYSPIGLNTVGYAMFRNCTSLTTFDFSQFTSVDGNAFNGCKSLKTLNSSGSITAIGENTFKDCVALKELEFSSQIKNIGSSAFAGCTSIPYATVDNGIQNIGENAFASCDSMDLLFIRNKSSSEITSMANYPWGLETSIINPTQYTSNGIKYRLFYNQNAETASMKNTLTYENDGSETASVTGVDENVSTAVISNPILHFFNVNTIESDAFSNNDKIYSIEIPYNKETGKGVTTIEENAFANTPNLKYVYFEDRNQQDVAEIGNYSWGLESTSVIKTNKYRIKVYDKNGNQIDSYNIDCHFPPINIISKIKDGIRYIFMLLPKRDKIYVVRCTNRTYGDAQITSNENTSITTEMFHTTDILSNKFFYLTSSGLLVLGCGEHIYYWTNPFNQEEFTQDDAKEVSGVSYVVCGITEEFSRRILVLDGENGKIHIYSQTTDSIVKAEDPIELDTESGKKLIALGNWSQSEYVRKYIFPDHQYIPCKLDHNTFNVNTYDSLHIRKHNEDWDAPTMMKTPVKNTAFETSNPTLFKAIGETFGTNQHGSYSISKKLFEGIANQVNNIHDVEECHVDNIYALANKEDVAMDNFILTYPEEMRRIADLASIEKEKLWGDRCHCTSNYFKAHKSQFATKEELDSYIETETERIEESFKNGKMTRENADFELNELRLLTVDSRETKLCKNCGHHHTSNLGDEIQQYNLDIVEKTTDGSYTISNPFNYVVENKLKRGEYTRITMSNASIQESMDILDAMHDADIPYLTDEDIEIMEQGGQNRRIINFVSIKEMEKAFSGTCGEMVSPYDNIKLYNAEIFAIHTLLFVSDFWFNYCAWYHIYEKCDVLNTSVINWESKFNTMPERNQEKTDKSDEYKTWYDKNGTMEKILNYNLHNGCLFNKDGEYVND